ncbi:MAG: 16S rRNA (guanine(966)-N(2))-methyltransferase RsmD [Peptococcaceae bacterium]
MRVIAGSCRGKRLKSVKGYSTRPTADRVKEAIFNVLTPQVKGTKVLDLFAGTGSIGIEALSRGSDFVCFVDKDRKAVQVIKENLSGCKLTDRAQILPLDYLKALNILKSKNINFDLIFLDPPYKMLIIEAILEKIIRLNLLAKDGVIIAETAQDSNLAIEYEDLVKVRENIYGDTKITYFQFHEEG